MDVNFQFLDLTDGHDKPIWNLSIEISTVSVKTGPIGESGVRWDTKFETAIDL